MLRFKVYNSKGEHIANTRDSIAAAALVSADPGAVIRDGLNGRRIVWREPPHGQTVSSQFAARKIDERINEIADERMGKFRAAGLVG